MTNESIYHFRRSNIEVTESPFRNFLRFQNKLGGYLLAIQEETIGPFRSDLIGERSEIRNLVDELCSILGGETKPLSRDSVGPEVVALQRALVLLAIDISPGIFGAKTDNFVKDLQRSLGHKVTGAVGPELRAFFCEASSDNRTTGGSIGIFRGINYRNPENPNDVDTSALNQRLCTTQTILHRGGQKGQEVIDVQRCLTQLEVLLLLKVIDTPKVKSNLYDGIFGPTTEAAVRNFQLGEDLHPFGPRPPNVEGSIDNLGVVGPVTRNALCIALKRASTPLSEQLIDKKGRKFHSSGIFIPHNTVTVRFKAGRDLNFVFKNDNLLSVLNVSITEASERTRRDPAVTRILNSITLRPGDTRGLGFVRPSTRPARAKEQVEWIFDFSHNIGIPKEVKWNLFST